MSTIPNPTSQIATAFTEPPALRIMLVDDSEPVRQRIRSMIEEAATGCVIAEAAGVGEALALFRRHLPDLVVLDLRLADGSGYEVLRQIKFEHPAVVVVVVSSFVNAANRTDWLDRGADYCFDKAGEFERLLDVLAGLGASARPAEEEGALRSNGSWLWQALEAAQTGTWDWDLVTGRIQWSPEHERLFGFRRGEFHGTYGEFATRLHPDDRAGLEAAVDRARESRNPYQHEFRVVWPDGSVHWIAGHGQFYYDAAGAPVRMLGAVRDITDRKEADARMRLQDAALSAAANAILITDAEGAIVWVNRAFTTFTGYTAEEVLGFSPSILKSGEQPPEFYADLWSTIKRGEVWRGQVRNRRRDGSIYDEAMTITPVADGAGAISHFIAIKEDITEAKKLEAQFLRSQRMESIGALAGGIAHDLNNALAPILMSCEFLAMVCKDSEMHRVLEVINSSARRGADMVRQVLAFARGSDRRGGAVQLKHLVREMKQIMEQTFPKEIAIHAESVAAELRPVIGCPTQLHQVLLNLCVNARDAMPDGGALTIAAENADIDAAFAAMTPEAKPGAYVRLTVRDTGTGMPVEVREQIFEPFFTTKEAGKGTGLGLSTVRSIVRDHGGFLTLHSEVGCGTEFSIYLPAQTGVEATIPVAATPPPTGHGELILVVDDEAAIRSIAKQTLELFGYRVVTASDGAQALGVCARHASELRLVITDLVMPVLDGASAIRAMEVMSPRMKFIVSSGRSPLSRRSAAINLDAHAHLPKPYGSDELLKLVHRVLQEEAAG